MGLGLSIHIMEKNNVPVTTNQVSLDSLDWLKEPPKKYIPFLDFPLGNSQIITLHP